MSDADQAISAAAREPEAASGSSSASPAQKDIWDKLPAITGLISSVVLGVIGLYFTYSYQWAESKRLEAESLRNNELKQHENQLTEVKIFETFLSHLQSSEQEFRVAVLGIETLDPELGQRVLQRYARNAPEERRGLAHQMIEERSITLLNTWNIAGVLQEEARLPAYLEADSPHVPADKRQNLQSRCSNWVKEWTRTHSKGQAPKREPAKFSVPLPLFIGEMRNYHYNGNCGSDGTRLTTIGPAGLTAPTIGVRDREGRQIGIWRAQLYYENSGRSGEEGARVPTAWIAYPSIVLMPGEYEVTDSDGKTWSFNEASKFAGISLVLALDSGR